MWPAVREQRKERVGREAVGLCSQAEREERVAQSLLRGGRRGPAVAEDRAVPREPVAQLLREASEHKAFLLGLGPHSVGSEAKEALFDLCPALSPKRWGGLGVAARAQAGSHQLGQMAPRQPT